MKTIKISILVVKMKKDSISVDLIKMITMESKQTTLFLETDFKLLIKILITSSLSKQSSNHRYFHLLT